MTWRQKVMAAFVYAFGGGHLVSDEPADEVVIDTQARRYRFTFRKDRGGAWEGSTQQFVSIESLRVLGEVACLQAIAWFVGEQWKCTDGFAVHCTKVEVEVSPGQWEPRPFPQPAMWRPTYAR